MGTIALNSTSTIHCDRFKEVASRFVRMAAVDGFDLIPYRDPRLIYFSILPVDAQEAILQQMELLIHLGDQMHDQKHSVRGPSQYAWSFCKALGLTPPSDLYAKIPDNTLIDIYDANHKLIFACLEFFEMVSYSLEELYSRPWMDLFVRDTETTHNSLMQLSEEILTGKHSHPIDVSYLGSHVIREAAHPDLRWACMQPRLFSPLYQNSKIVGYVCANEVIALSINCIPAKRELARNSPTHYGK